MHLAEEYSELVWAEEQNTSPNVHTIWPAVSTFLLPEPACFVLNGLAMQTEDMSWNLKKAANAPRFL